MERVILVGVEKKRRRDEDGQNPSLDSTLAELGRLVETAGGTVAASLVQRMERYHPATLIGPGKAEELAALAARCGAKAVVFDEDLTPAQQRKLEEAVSAKILDRTRLILDIFAQRARTREGKLQVELAQLDYLLPRITERFGRFEQQVGGIGTRGPGERKLEIDKRRIRDRIARLRREIEGISSERALQRAARTAVPFPVAALVGYTNAGKSTLTNALVGPRAEKIYADDKLFATLDPTTRRVRLPAGGWALVTDTVGFIQKLPHALVASFRATLEEISQADCLIHVLDGSSNEARAQHAAVLEVLREIGADDRPIVTAVNKADLLPAPRRRALRIAFPEAIMVSALNGTGLRELLEAVEGRLARRWQARELFVPHAESSKLDEIHRVAQVISRHSGPEGTRLQIRATPENWTRLQRRFALRAAVDETTS